MLAPLLALAMQLPSDQGNGSGLYSACKAYVSFIDRTGQPSREFDEGTCIGYVSGYADSGNDERFCASEATMGTIVRVYLAYMDKNPKLFDMPRAYGLELALRESYPCPAKK